jgi:hypothetical protein
MHQGVKSAFQTLADDCCFPPVRCGHADSAKTRWAWVYLDNTTQHCGSALRSRAATSFDAIVFGEKAAGKWMAAPAIFSYARRTIQ